LLKEKKERGREKILAIMMRPQLHPILTNLQTLNFQSISYKLHMMMPFTE
jgi:hypothetical protein